MKAHESTGRVVDDMEAETASTWQKVRGVLDLEKSKPKPVLKVQPRYCYRSYSDVQCYREPVVGQDERLIAYQDGQRVGYTFAPPSKIVSKELRHKASAKVQVSAAQPTPSVAPAAALPAGMVGPVLPAASSSAATPAPAAAGVPAPASKYAGKVEEKKLKEIIFDPKELEPKKLVPDKAQ